MLTTFILSMRATPYYYFGDEIGMSNVKFDNVEDYNDVELHTNYAQVKAKGGDMKRFLEGMKISSRDNGRTPMQWDTTTGAGFTTGTPWLKINPNYNTVNVAAAETDANSCLNYFRKMIKLRKNNEALIYGAFTLVDTDNPDVFAFTRELKGNKFLILLNFRNKDVNVKTGVDASKAEVLINNYTTAPAADKLRPYEAVIFKL
jgi:oligo-1,6-glucosidase